jgi:glycosyltransferase involved in cell wall biosynthesis
LEKAGTSIVKKSPKVLIYDPYLTTLGGGERVMLEIFQALKANYQVVIGAPELPASDELAEFGYVADIMMEKITLPEFTRKSRDFEVVFYLTNEIPKASRAKHSFLIVQFPFTHLPRFNFAKRLFQKKTLSGYTCLVYSDYCKYWLAKRWGVRSQILTPPVELGTYDPSKKRSLIISVGRFFVSGHSKRQDVLIEAYKLLPENVQEKWKLVLAGSIKDDAADQEYLQKLEKDSRGLNIEFATNISRSKLEEYYNSSSIYWHAAGFGRGDNHPEKAEHFGITTIEAMSYGCIPMAYNDGGQTEILKDSGYLWKTTKELASYTVEVVQAKYIGAQAEAAARKSKAYSTKVFHSRIYALVESV